VSPMGESSVNRPAIHEELERARTTFRQLLDGAGRADLRRSTEGARWTNEQTLFHMLFGYILMRPLLVLLRVFGRLPPGVGQGSPGFRMLRRGPSTSSTSWARSAARRFSAAAGQGRRLALADKDH